ncbi:MAG: hypothetical protein FWG98_10210 [Candidatus Cloacimonetes bacterium]|nr:hypothetical protein [Candidatus Cloacimonadota bacterium]
MIAVYIDPTVDKYNRQIKFALEYMLDISGYVWKYLDPETELNPNDVIVYYSSSLPDPVYLEWMITNHSFVHIPFNKDLYVKGFFVGDQLKYNLKTFNIEDGLPYISSKRSHKSPVNFVDHSGCRYCTFDFDIIGNVFFHLSDDNRNHLKSKDKKTELSLSDLGFNEYFHLPYINHFIDFFSLILKDLIENKNLWSVKTCLWPGGQEFAAIISHDLDKMQKWGITSLSMSFFENFYLLFTFKITILFKNILSVLKYLFSNIEEYWNIYEISKLEKKYRFHSTWFIGINKDKKQLFDYDFDDKDILKELGDVIKNGSEVALLYKSKEISTDRIKKEYDMLMSKLKINKSGIRHVNSFAETEIIDKIQTDMGIKFDSSRRPQTKNGFYNGFALPYPVFSYDTVVANHNVIQLPISFTDQLLKLDKYKFVSYIEAMEQIKEVVSSVKKVQGLFHIQFSNSLYHDIPYMPKLFEYVLDLFKSQNAFVTTCSDMVEWYENRNQMIVIEDGNRVIIRFLIYIDQITFEIVGKKIISNVFGGNCSYKKNIVQFVNVFKGLEVEINLIDMEPE